jgi:hypothetical protein
MLISVRFIKGSRTCFCYYSMLLQSATTAWSPCLSKYVNLPHCSLQSDNLSKDQRSCQVLVRATLCYVRGFNSPPNPIRCSALSLHSSASSAFPTIIMHAFDIYCTRHRAVFFIRRCWNLRVRLVHVRMPHLSRRRFSARLVTCRTVFGRPAGHVVRYSAAEQRRQ